jgi:hypothetical protein
VDRREFCAGLLAAALLPGCGGRQRRAGGVPAWASGQIVTDMFRPIAGRGAHPYSAASDLDGYEPASARSREPLGHRRWRVRWQAALGEAANPGNILVGGGLVIVSGSERRGIWDASGRPCGFVRGDRWSPAFLDLAGKRLVAASGDDGLTTRKLPGGERDAAILLPMVGLDETAQILEGPAHMLVFVAKIGHPEQRHQQTTVVSARVRDYEERDKNGFLAGVDAVAVMVRESRDVVAAAARPGPVFATDDGILWCDWNLRPLREHRLQRRPLSLSVDGDDRACLLATDEMTTHLSLVPPGGPAAADVAMPFPPEAGYGSPIVAPDGTLFLTPRDQVLALSPAGAVLWQQRRASAAPGAATADGFLLFADDQLYAVTAREGRREPLWRPPSPLLTAAVLAGGLLHVASADTLFVLEPAAGG